MRRTGSRRGRTEPRAKEPPGPQAALDLALHFLATRPRSRWEVEQRLRRAAADDATIGSTLERLAELGYIDDAAFARWWAEQRDRHAPRGQRMIAAELRRHRVDRDAIANLEVTGAEERADGLPETEEERAAVALARHLRGRPMPTDRAALQRLGMFLVRRGFDPETVRSTLRRAGTASEEEDS